LSTTKNVNWRLGKLTGSIKIRDRLEARKEGRLSRQWGPNTHLKSRFKHLTGQGSSSSHTFPSANSQSHSTPNSGQPRDTRSFYLGQSMEVRSPTAIASMEPLNPGDKGRFHRKEMNRLIWRADRQEAEGMLQVGPIWETQQAPAPSTSTNSRTLKIKGRSVQTTVWPLCQLI
jgi:hypothetical protein